MFSNLMSHKLKVGLSLSIFPLIFSVSVYANEGGKPAEAPPAGGGHGDAKGAVTAAEKPWVNLQNQVLVLKTKRMQLMQNMAAIKEASAAHGGGGRGGGTHGKQDSKHVKEEIDSLVKLYKEYKEVTEEYNKSLVILKYRFPERLAKEDEREYKPMEVESLEALESQMDIETRLSKVYKKAQSQYSAPKDRVPASEKATSPKAEKIEGNTIREQNPILLSQ